MNVDEVRHPSAPPPEEMDYWKTDLCFSPARTDQSPFSSGFQLPGPGHLAQVRKPEIGELVLLDSVHPGIGRRVEE